MKTRPWLILTFVCWIVVALAGCSRSPRANFYILEPTAKAGVALPAKNAPTVAIAAITLPEIVDRPQLVVRVDGSRVDILEMHRWAEPLKSGIARLLAENLSRLLGLDHVWLSSQNIASETHYRIFVDIRRFESTADSVTVDSFWTIRRSTQESQKTGRSQIHEPRGGEGFETLVSAYNRALAAVSNDIARAIRSEWAAPR
ncbi:MAG: PqiC family protein [Deltaproteobacteria bacterium]